MNIDDRESLVPLNDRAGAPISDEEYLVLLQTVAASRYESEEAIRDVAWSALDRLLARKSA